MWVHLFHRNVWYTVIILEEGTPPPPLVSPVHYDGSLESIEQAEPHHQPLRQGGGEEALTDGGIGDAE